MKSELLNYINKPAAIIFGITGQDGSYLSELLLSKGYHVIGIRRSTATDNLGNLKKLERITCTNLLGNITFEHGDVTDAISVNNLIDKYKPLKVFNLAAQSHVGISFETPLLTANVDGIGTLNILEAIRVNSRGTKFYQASTSELFGGQLGIPLNEETTLNPRSPYAAAKLYAYHMVKVYREAYGLYCVNGILFNHESPLRGDHFVTQKIVKGLVKKAFSKPFSKVSLGNLNAIRDWGHAKDYVRVMDIMLDQEEPIDLVIGSEVATSVRSFCEITSAHLGKDFYWEGDGRNERLIWREVDGDSIAVDVDQRYYRPLEVDHLQADCSKARATLNWSPSITVNQLVSDMICEAKVSYEPN